MRDEIVKKREELQLEAVQKVKQREELLRQLTNIDSRLAELAGAIKTLDELLKMQQE